MTNKLFWGVQLTSIRILSRSPMKTKNMEWIQFELSNSLSCSIYGGRWWLFERKTSKTYSSIVGLCLFDIYRIECRLYPSNSGKWCKVPGNASANFGDPHTQWHSDVHAEVLAGKHTWSVLLCFTLRFPFNLKCVFCSENLEIVICSVIFPEICWAFASIWEGFRNPRPPARPTKWQLTVFLLFSQSF